MFRGTRRHFPTPQSTIQPRTGALPPAARSKSSSPVTPSSFWSGPLRHFLQPLARPDLAGWRGLPRFVKEWCKAPEEWGGSEVELAPEEFYHQFLDLLGTPQCHSLTCGNPSIASDGMAAQLALLLESNSSRRR